jgi:FtsZ-binding cell division protein ZapB
VKIIESLRHDIEEAITQFSQQNQDISQDRQQDILHIRGLLDIQHPLELRLRLFDYVTHLSTGLASILPFLEVNKLKNALKQVLNLPKYQEYALLRSIMSEGHVSQPSDPHLLARVEKLEQSVQGQTQEISLLQREVGRLKGENKALLKTISMLAGKNKVLAEENLTLKQEKTKVEQDTVDIKQQYQLLMNENINLKNQISRLQSKPDVAITTNAQRQESNGKLSVQSKTASATISQEPKRPALNESRQSSRIVLNR